MTKTYIACGLLALGAIGAYLLDKADLAMNLLGTAAIGAGLRHAIQKTAAATQSEG